MKLHVPAVATLLAVAAVGNSQSTPKLGANDRAQALRSEAQSRKLEAIGLARAKGFPSLLNLPNGKTIELMRLRNGRPAYFQTMGMESADTVGADEVWSGGSAGLNLSGLGVVLGEWDAGKADRNHPEFINGGTYRVTYADAGTAPHGHSIHVAGIMTATGLTAAAKGISYASTLQSYDWNTDLSEMTLAADAGLLVSNHSYGYICGWSNNLLGDGKWAWVGESSLSTTTDWQFGFYSEESRQLDQVLYDHPNYLAVWAAGNSRGGGPTTQPVEHWEWNSATGNWVLTTAARELNGGASGYDTLTIGHPVAKNDLVIGAIKPISGGYTSPSGVSIPSWSSSGPTDDGRIKPDLASPGNNIYSTFTNGGYTYSGGTSMAAPAVTGSIGLLIQHHRNLFNANPLAATVKAALIHTADQGGAAPGPNYRTGWGVVDVLSASGLLSSEASRRDTVFERTLRSGEKISLPLVSDGSGPLKATIVWTDPAGTVGAPELNNRTPKLVNDLDMRIVGNGQTFSPWTLDPLNPASPASTGDNFRDNVEQVTIPAPTAGAYTINISAKNATLAPSGTQNFTLIVTGHRIARIQSLAVSPTTVIGDGTHSATGTVTLDSLAPKNGAIVSLSSDNPAAAVPATVTVPAGSRTANFTINVGRVSGDQAANITAACNGSTDSSSLGIEAAANLDATFVGQSIPSSLKAGQTFVASITMKNDGSQSWVATSGTGYCLVSQNPAGNTTWGIDKLWIPNGTTVNPGASYTFKVTLKAPATAGTYNFQWRMRQSGNPGLQFGSPTQNLAVTVSEVNDAVFMSQSVPTSVKAGTKFNATVTFKNTGTTTWKDGAYCIISQAPEGNSTWGVSKIWLPSTVSVAPGASYTFTYSFTAPANTGTHTFQWRMRQSGNPGEQFGGLSTSTSISVTP
ncbi:hypothetical protein EON82_02895 [bacterium]|nr:MAG: hypothetical protein EON82_02895 [bacterium]